MSKNIDLFPFGKKRERENKAPNMGISIFSLFPTFSLSFLLLSLNFPTTQSSPSSIYDHLESNGLPMGLLPKGITDFSMDPDTHRFQVNLTQPCNAKFENQFHYDFNISGVLSFGKIANLSGVLQQELFLWFPVISIRVDDPSSGLINFDVGVVDKQFSLSLFEIPRDCTAVDPDDSHSQSENSQKPSESLGIGTVEEHMLRAVS